MTTWDLLVRGGTLVDGTGAEPRRADVGVLDGRVGGVGDLAADSAATVVDATDRVVTPGFVDVHTHSDLTLLSNPLAHSKVRQGVTTEVVGNCGLGVAPLAGPAGTAGAAAIRASVGYLDLDPDVEWSWSGWPGYLDAVEKARPSVNVAALVGHLPLHAGVVGFDDRPATRDELDRMAGLLSDALAAGAVGLSTGLMYAPLTFARPDELVALGEVVAAHDRLFAWHLRDYADDLVGAVEQALEVGERTGCRTQLSHLIAVGKRNWAKLDTALELVDAARGRGLDVAVDVYPYLAGNAPLSQRLPAWVQDGGTEAMRERLADPDVVRAVREAWAADSLGWEDVTVNSAPLPAGAEVTGRSVTELAVQRGTDPDAVAIELLVEFGNAVTMIAFGRYAGNLTAVLRHPASVVGSDGQALDPDGPTGHGVPHPRSYGCYPRLFADFVRTGAGRTGTLSLAEAVRKCTSAPARRVGLTDRGVVEAGSAADLVVLDLDRIEDRATFAEPQRFPTGIDAVVVNGGVVVDHQGHTGHRPGAVHRAR